ncbi:hypothetical protein SEA_CEN1621_42 [Microbacterium phage Cen1621]|uniref:Uncharacterized protein n=1 Tax=Microbacterium phage Cen1621 TaxID=2965191 RepID=A0A9E7Q9V0_9CAUD|nr:hypothetical protein SEA_CEN1621_42 [Microbacterium phage Cen1621]
MARTDNRFIVTDRPFYSFGPGARVYLDEELGKGAPRVGDVVKIDNLYIDDDGDYDFTFKGRESSIAAECVVNVGKLLDIYRDSLDVKANAAESDEELADWERELLRTAPKVSGRAHVLSVSAVADTLVEQTTLDGPDIDLAVAFALLRSTGTL